MRYKYQCNDCKKIEWYDHPREYCGNCTGIALTLLDCRPINEITQESENTENDK